MKPSILVVLECGGKSISIGSGGTLGLLGISGIEAAEHEVDVEDNGSLDGGYISGARITQRIITVKTDLAAEDSEVIRSRLVHMFRPHADTRITVTRNGVTRWITGRSQTPVFSESNMYSPAAVTLKFICPQPYFYDPSDYGKDIAEHLDNVVLPFVIPPEGFVVAVRSQNTQVQLTNGGDVATGVRARIVCSGAVVNPCIRSGTGKFVRILGEFSAGDVIVISTESRAKGVRVNGVNSMHRTDRASTFFSLAVGENTIEYDADDGYDNMAVYIYYTPLYLGV